MEGQVIRTGYKHPLSRIYFYITGGCNLACKHCWIVPDHTRDGKDVGCLDINTFSSVIRQAIPLGVKGVKLTGGEPLLHPQFADILEVVRVNRLRLQIETNATLCTPELAQKIKRIGDNTFVSVSLDSAEASIHEWIRNVKGSFDAALAGIRNLIDAGLRPQLIMTIMRRNRDQMEGVIRLAESLGAGSVKFNILQPTARGKRMHADGEAMDIEELVEIGRWVENELPQKTGLPVYFDHPVAFRPLSRIFDKRRNGTSLCGILRIIGVLSDGSYALCGIGETAKGLVFGNAKTDCLEHVWYNNPVLREIREGLPHRLKGICADCLMRGRCLGACIAQNYYRTGDLWSPFWYCEEAWLHGLFPLSRIKHISRR